MNKNTLEKIIKAILDAFALGLISEPEARELITHAVAINKEAL